ncbi:MAG: DUF6132 family protein [Bacteroidetes bacterium]|nr:DUF6132 family protein [Bacteroidota bacterium]
MDLFKTYGLTMVGVLLGAIGGYWYYAKVGCATGTCPITSNPWISTLYGALLGGLALNIFKK